MRVEGNVRADVTSQPANQTASAVSRYPLAAPSLESTWDRLATLGGQFVLSNQAKCPQTVGGTRASGGTPPRPEERPPL